MILFLKKETHLKIITLLIIMNRQKSYALSSVQKLDTKYLWKCHKLIKNLLKTTFILITPSILMCANAFSFYNI